MPQVRLRDLSVFVTPPNGWVMAALVYRFYGDDSGEECDPTHTVSCVGGFITHSANWEGFEGAWRAGVLDRFHIPYVHMKEMSHRGFAHLKTGEPDSIPFMQSMILALRSHFMNPIMSSVRLADLRRFNEEHRQQIDDYSLNVYSCMWLIHQLFGENPVEAFFDRTTSVGSRLDIARAYAASDPSKGDLTRTIDVRPIHPSLTFRDLPAVQAADFLAWELHREMEGRDRWFSALPSDLTYQEYRNSLYRWAKSGGRRFLYHRRSLGTLARSMMFREAVWDYRALCHAHEARNGNWTTSSDPSTEPPA